jgi:hypothetical protein
MSFGLSLGPNICSVDVLQKSVRVRNTAVNLRQNNIDLSTCFCERSILRSYQPGLSIANFSSQGVLREDTMFQTTSRFVAEDFSGMPAPHWLP